MGDSRPSKPVGPCVALKDGALTAVVLRDGSFQTSRLPPPPTTNAQALPQDPQPLLCPQGTYVLQDNSFPLLIRMASGLQYVEEAPKVGGCWDTPTPHFSCFPGPRG